MNYFVILPHQLYDKKYIPKENRESTFLIWEHPHYFNEHKYNKKKILLHRASMKYYIEYLQKHKYKCEYLNFENKLKIKKYTIFDPIDKIKLNGDVTKIESPNFLLTKELQEKYREKTDKFFFNGFYMWSKKQLDIMPNIKSQDKYNRKSLPKNIDIPRVKENTTDMKYIKEAKQYVEKHFSNNYGNTDNFIFPVTHKTAKKFITNFIKNKIKKFGDYQDAIIENESFLFHSLLSSSMNIGLINPIELIKKIEKADAPLNSREGFIRQLFWREYQRYCYNYYNFDNKNYFGNNNRLDKSWYDGTTGIIPIDNCIKNGFDTGYLHHIERLMVIGNYMNLCKIHPKEGYKWFMEFSCDSYDWVMKQNVLDMVFFVSGGKTMRRPYMSSSNYIRKMSNYDKGEWSQIWDDKYRQFIKSNEDKLYKYRYFYKIPKKK